MNSVGAQEVVELTGQDRPLRSDYEEVYRVGSFDGDLWETFGEIGGTAFDANGNLYIAQPPLFRASRGRSAKWLFAEQELDTWHADQDDKTGRH